MLSERLGVLIESVGASNTDISKLAECAPSYISRLRNGERIPKKSTAAMQRLAGAICQFAEDNRCQDTLFGTMGMSRAESDKENASAILSWMYESADMPRDNAPDNSEKARIFTNKLEALVNLSGLTNKELSEQLCVDPSYISRIRNGTRTLKRQSKILSELSYALGKQIIRTGKRHKLSELTAVPADSISYDTVGTVVTSWLLDCSTGTEIIYIKKILESLNKYGPEEMRYSPAPAVYGGTNDTRTSYRGIEGLRAGVDRLLKSVIRNGGSEILLYSDQGMSWMLGDFHSKWLSLMTECLKRQIKIRIIHFIERDNLEMLAGINSWMPLYMSGLIDSYYSTLPAGELFGRTLFIAPGIGAVEGCCARGFEKNCEYRYITETDQLEMLCSEYQYMLTVPRKLVYYSTEMKKIPPHAAFKNMDNIEIGAADGVVIVNRVFSPQASFTFDNPRVYDAFRKYLE